MLWRDGHICETKGGSMTAEALPHPPLRDVAPLPAREPKAQWTQAHVHAVGTDTDMYFRITMSIHSVV